jgi:hypothetical protein
LRFSSLCRILNSKEGKGGEKRMKKTSLLTAPLAVTLLCAFIAPAFAASTTVTYGNAYDLMNYTQITGTLGGAAYIIQIPETWNGMLVVACPWYQFPPNSNCHLLYNPLSLTLLTMGYAFACSNYGADGFPIQKGMIRIHQLTEYVIDNYHVTGKVFVMGGSMGGNIALLLGVKYPDLYSGVLDLFSAKDWASAYNGASYIAILSLDQIRAVMGWPPTVPDASVQLLKDFMFVLSNDIRIETGGTPETKPQAYSRISAIDNVDLSVPVISIVGAKDFLVPFSDYLLYQNAVDEAGHSDLYRMYIIPDGGHVDGPIFAAVPAHLTELVAWSDSLD